MLPKISSPLVTLTIPSTKREVRFRPYTVAEEKILLMAKQSGDATDIQVAIKQIIVLCAVDPINDDELTSFDIDYLYIKLYSISVNDLLKLTYKDNEDDKEYKVSINLKDIEVQFPEGHTNKIMVTDTIGAVMSYPPAIIPEYVLKADTLTDLTLAVIKLCTKQIFDENEVYELDTLSFNEFDEWMNNLSEKQLEGFFNFIKTMPHISHTVSWTNSLGNERNIELRNLNDFFSLR